MKDSIKAGELRLNNWVRVTFDGIDAFGKIKGIFNNCVYLNNAFGDFALEHIHPIPISNEVLEKVKGCELISESPYRATWDVEHSGGRYITIVNHKPAKTWEVTFGSTIELQKPFLHTLHNVVYFNWGKELEITL